MRNVRICQFEANLNLEQEFCLDDDGFGHLIKVLRFKQDDPFTVFNGLETYEYEAVLTEVTNKKASFKCLKKIERNVESPLLIELGQVVSKGDKMEFTIQKACELGIYKITPLYSQRCNVKLDDKRKDKKQEQWQKIAISACEQCGRTIVPKVAPITNIDTWYQENRDYLNLTLDPRANVPLSKIQIQKRLRLLVGPEGGLDESEVNHALEFNFKGVSLGPRILRTETAALAALSILGSAFGDL